MKVAWPTDYLGDGNSFGYSVHNDEARRALLREGFSVDPGARVAIHVAPAHRFRPLEGKLNILYTAWESTDLTPDVRDGLARADAVAVTARFLVDAVRRELPGSHVHYCPLGVRAQDFPFVERRDPNAKDNSFHRRARRGRRERQLVSARFQVAPRLPSFSACSAFSAVKAVVPGRRFRFLWLGAPNERKGWGVAMEAWRGLARIASMPGARLPRAELYVKTSVTGRRAEIPVRCAPVIFDSRRLPRAELSRLYRSAHAFLFPSFGEGFGLTMAEAMASGLPVLFTPWSAMRDLADESCGYPLRYELIRHDLQRQPQRQKQPQMNADKRKLNVSARDAGGSICVHQRSSAVPVSPWAVTFARASPEDLLRRMIEIMTDYGRALRKGRLAASRIRREFSWERTGRTLAKIVRRECERHGNSI
ncbi:MAG: glycosyltransferase [Planctomycetota bacterium]|jgi:glycosyltransferase involved in cell wall biosynthesis